MKVTTKKPQTLKKTSEYIKQIEFSLPCREIFAY